MKYEVSETPQEELQTEFDFDKKDAVIIGALCFDGARGYGREKFTCDLTSVGDGTYIDNKRLRYERVISRDVNGPGPRFVRKEDKK